MKLENTTLFFRPTCPYCRKVLGFMEENDIQVGEEKNVLEGNNQMLLEEETGQTAVPALIADGKPIVGSDVIIDYMERHL